MGEVAVDTPVAIVGQGELAKLFLLLFAFETFHGWGTVFELASLAATRPLHVVVESLLGHIVSTLAVAVAVAVVVATEHHLLLGVAVLKRLLRLLCLVHSKLVLFFLLLLLQLHLVFLGTRQLVF